MAECDSEIWASKQIRWVLQSCAVDLWDKCPSVALDQPIREVTLDLDDAEYLCELIHEVFPMKPTGQRLDRDFVQLIYATNGDCTVGEMAEFIDGNYEIVRIEPAALFGHPCLAAGVFRSLQDLVRFQDSNSPSFGPSSRVGEVLRGRNLRQFFSKVQILTCGGVQLPAYVRQIDGAVSVLTLVSVPFVLSGILLVEMHLLDDLPVRGNWSVLLGLAPMFGTAAICLGLQELYRIGLEGTLRFLPNANRTFRDLAYQIVHALQVE